MYLDFWSSLLRASLKLHGIIWYISHEVPCCIVGGLILEKLKKFHRFIARAVAVPMVFVNLTFSRQSN